MAGARVFENKDSRLPAGVHVLSRDTAATEFSDVKIDRSRRSIGVGAYSQVLFQKVLLRVLRNL